MCKTGVFNKKNDINELSEFRLTKYKLNFDNWTKFNFDQSESCIFQIFGKKNRDLLQNAKKMFLFV